MLAKELMTKELITVSPAIGIRELALLLVKNQISGAPVVDRKGKIIGVVSEADIVGKKGKNVGAIMSKKVIGVSEDTPVEDIARLMTGHKITRLPVMRGDKLIGIVSRADIVNAIAMGKHLALSSRSYRS